MDNNVIMEPNKSDINSIDLDQMFASFRSEIVDDQQLREDVRVLVRDLESKGREMLAILQKTHSSNNLTILSDLEQVRTILTDDVQPLYRQLSEKISSNDYYKYHDHYRWINQRMVFLVAFLKFLNNGTLVTRTEVATQLNLADTRSNGFHLDLEDYLSGLLQLASELARFAVNSVSAGDNSRPFQIAAFLFDLDAKFRLLNLKNDNLRKRFDVLKYDVQKVEHVVYDLTIRGMQPMKSNASGDNIDESMKKC